MYLISLIISYFLGKYFSEKYFLIILLINLIILGNFDENIFNFLLFTCLSALCFDFGKGKIKISLDVIYWCTVFSLLFLIKFKEFEITYTIDLLIISLSVIIYYLIILKLKNVKVNYKDALFYIGLLWCSTLLIDVNLFRFCAFLVLVFILLVFKFESS
jgi:hypothetical protein